MSAKRKGSGRTSPDSEALQEITEAWIDGANLHRGEKLVRRGRPKLNHPRKLLSLRLPPAVIARWKATGPGWQSRMANVLEKCAPKSTRTLG